MGMTVKVKCDGYGSHSEIEFEIDLAGVGYTNLDPGAIRRECPVCQLNDKVAGLENTINGQWDELRKLKQLPEKVKDDLEEIQRIRNDLKPMHDWWRGFVTVDEACQSEEGDIYEGVG